MTWLFRLRCSRLIWIASFTFSANFVAAFYKNKNITDRKCFYWNVLMFIRLWLTHVYNKCMLQAKFFIQRIQITTEQSMQVLECLFLIWNVLINLKNYLSQVGKNECFFTKSRAENSGRLFPIICFDSKTYYRLSWMIFSFQIFFQFFRLCKTWTLLWRTSILFDHSFKDLDRSNIW